MKHETRNTERRGVTLLELVVTIGILSILFGLGLLASLDFYRSNTLSSERDNVVAFLRRARSRALNNVRQADHGVVIGSSTYTIFQGSSYAGRDAAFDEEFPRTSGLSISGLSEIIFRPLDGSANASGSIILGNGTRSSTISVNTEGRIDW